MDYSLLIGVKRERFEVIHKGDSASSREASMSTDTKRNWHVSAEKDRYHREADGGMPAKMVEGPGMYYFGVIDILQEWNWTKRLERFFKMTFRLEDGNGLSAINSVAYADRFYKRCVMDTFEGIDANDLLTLWTTMSTETSADARKLTIESSSGQASYHSSCGPLGLRQVRALKAEHK